MLTMPMRAVRKTVLALVLVGALASAAFGAGNISDELRGILLRFKKNGSLWIGCEKIHASSDLVDFYKKRRYAPAWVGPEGVNALGQSLVRALQASDAHGLRAADYHYGCIRSWVGLWREQSSKCRSMHCKELAGLDIVMTDAFLTYGSHLVNGKVDPERLYPQWLAEKRKADVLAVLNNVLQHRDVHRGLRNLAPRHPDYWRLIDAAHRMKIRVDRGGWPRVSAGRILRAGDSGKAIAALRQRLSVDGYFSHPWENDGGNASDSAFSAGAGFFDSGLVAAVKQFQRRHGLDPDGAVGPATLTALNVPAEERWHQILLNLERWRWLPRDWGARYIVVNTADYGLQAYDGGSLALEMRVIVGEAYTKTPVFSKPMRYIEINPYWNVPRRIATDEILPRIKADAAYLAKNHYELIEGWGEPSLIVDPLLIDWTQVRKGNFRWRLRQRPGPWNSLGQIKFMFPNRFDVYLHDTSERHLFRNHYRALSHGCIRLERPVDLAVFLLQDNPGWDRWHLEQVIAAGVRRVVRPQRACRVHLLYWTAWVDANEGLQFRPDIYDRDGILWEALNRLPEEAQGPPQSLSVIGLGDTYQLLTGPTSR